jgi:uncharacterized protein (DUF1697 family)
MPQARKNNSQYVAFLRGINVGGHAVIKMAVLEREFGSDLTTRNWNTILKTLA